MTQPLLTFKTKLEVIAFDCFNTVFDMTTVESGTIRDYVEHVNKHDFTPFNFHPSWYEVKAHPDAMEGIKRLRARGYKCVTLSNGEYNLLDQISKSNNIEWDHIIDLAKHQVYKPHLDAYHTVQKDLGVVADKTLLVTANRTFGDLEGAASIGMNSILIRSGGIPKDIIDLAHLLGCH